MSTNTAVGPIRRDHRAGRRRFGVHEPKPSQRRAFLEELLQMLKGGEHRDELIVEGLGRAVSEQEPVIVRGRGEFVVRVVR